MPAAVKKTLIAALVAAAGLAAVAAFVSPASADAPAVQAADARAAAAAGPDDRETRLRSEDDPAASQPFSAGREGDDLRADTASDNTASARKPRRRARRRR